MLSETRPAKVGKWTEPALRVLRERYLMREGGEVVETPEEMCWRVALSIAAGEGRYGRSDAAVGEIAAAFYEMMIDGYFLPNSPTLMNAGKGNGLQYSACYVLPVGDSMEEIFDSVKAAAIIHKCLVGDTLVMSDGLTRLKDVPDGAVVMTDAGPFYASARHDNGEQRVFEVRTNRGYKIVGTDEHRLLAVTPDGAYAWRKIGEIRSGDWLVMQPGPWTGGETKLPQFTFTQKPGGNCMSFKAREYRLPRELTPDLAELIGLYIGDGSNHRDGIRFTVGGHSPEVVRRIQELSVTLFGKAASVSKYPRENAYEVAILSTQVKQWFAFLGFTKTLSREARVPEIILRGPEAEACAFLRGLFTADGCVRTNGHITLTTSSRQLGEELQIMLFALGIPTKLRADVSPTGYESYQLSVCTRSGFRRFREKIGFASEMKARRLAAVDERTIFVRGETIPNQRARLRAWYDGLPADSRRRAKVEFDDLLNRVTAPRELTRQRVTRAIERSASCPPFFKDLAAEEFFFVRVTGVRDAGVQRVYDLTVPEKHAYLANGFVSHNSGGGCISGDARVWTTFCGLEPIQVLANRATADGRPGERSGAGVAFDVSDLNISTVAMDPKTGETGLRRVTHVWRFDVPAELQVLVETREGTQIQTSAWHPFMVMRPEGLVAVRADELAAGDVILGPDRPDAYWPYATQQRAGGLVIDESIGWLVGFTLGDGSFGYVPALRQYRLRWFSGEPDVLDKVRAVLAGRGINVSIQKDRRGLLSVATLTQRFVLDMLEACGLEKIGAKDERVRVPEVIAKSPLSVVRAFVAGLLDSDGYVAPDGSPSYATASREMAEDLAGLMSLLGYQPSLAAKPPRGKGKRTIYQVQLCPLPQVDDLRTDIAPHAASGHKLARLVSRSRKQTALRLRYRPWRDRLKALGLLGSARHGVGPCSAQLNRWSCNPNRRCRRDDLLAIADTVTSRDAGLGRLLQRVATRGLEIAAVGRAPEPKAFYDLSVEGWNTYAAGTHGMAFVHNTGFAFSRLRPKDDIVASTGGRASGPVSFLRVFNSATEAVKQGGTRRGANMGILKVDHPDILEFIDCKLDGGITNFNISVAATDTFMDALAAGGEYDLVNPHSGAVTGRLSAKEVFDRIVRAAWRTGDPGMVFIDRINASPANPTPEIGVVEATNPCGEQPLLPNEACFAPGTRITTDRGLESVADLYERQQRGEPVLVATNLNGRGMHIIFRPAAVVKVGVKPTVRVTLTNGQQIRVTPDHRIMTEGGWKEAGALTRDDRVLIQTAMAGGLDITSTDGDLQRLFGWFSGDGWFTTSVGLTFGPEDDVAFQRLVPVWREFTGSANRIQTQATMVRCIATERAEAIAAFGARGFGAARGPAKRAPQFVFTAPKEEQIRYLQGLFCADGSKTHRKPQVTLSSASLELLRDVQLLLLNLGMRSNIKYYPHRPTGRAWGQVKVNGESYHRFLDLVGFPLSPKKQEKCEKFPWQRTKHDRLAIPVASVAPDGEVDVYDVSEPVTHSLIAEGMIVHNCNLGSLNVSKFARRGEGGEWTLDWDEMERVVRLGVRFLDDVIEMNPYPLPEIDATVKSNRRVGLGIMGWADLLFTMGIAYDSQEAIDLADRLMAFVKDKAHDQTAKLAEERGPFPHWSRSIYKHERPLRNSTVTTIAPTGTISMIAGCSSGVEPIFALAFEHRVKQPDGERVLTFVNETFEAIAKDQGFYSDALMQEIAKRGSLHGIPGVPEGAAQVFKTSHEIGFEWHVRHQAAFQRYTDNGVSKTINLPNAATEADVARAYTLAWELGCLGITVFRDGCKGEQVLNVGVGKKEPAAALPTTGPVVIRPRPHSLTGSTYRTETPIGTAFITVNQTPDGDPFEVFVQVGKGGSDTMAVAEALGRLISLSLRLPSQLSAQRRLEEVISQLSRIGGGQPTGFGPAKILSLPDALARTLAQHIGQVKAAPEVPVAGTDTRKKIGDLCKECGQATFIYEEGCKKCLSCGFNEC